MVKLYKLLGTALLHYTLRTVLYWSGRLACQCNRSLSDQSYYNIQWINQCYDAISSHTTSSHHIDDHEMLQDSCGTLAVNRRIIIIVKSSSTMWTFLSDTQCLSRAAGLIANRSAQWWPKERCNFEMAKKFIGRSNFYNSKVCSMNRTNWVGVYF